jgi:hypothetical protein
VCRSREQTGRTSGRVVRGIQVKDEVCWAIVVSGSLEKLVKFIRNIKLRDTQDMVMGQVQKENIREAVNIIPALLACTLVDGRSIY